MAQSWQYQKRSETQLAKRASQKGSSFEGWVSDEVQTYRMKAGDNAVRILPPTWEGAEHYGYDVFVHHNIGPDNAAVLCLAKMTNKPCPVCEERAKLDASGDTDEATKLKPIQRVACWILDLDDRKKGAQVWGMPWTVDRDIAKISKDRRDGSVYAIDDPEEGYDLYISREGDRRNTKYTGIQLARKSSEIPREILKFVVDNPLPEQLNWRDYNEILELWHGGAEEQPRRRGRPSDDDDRGSRSRSRPDDDDRPTRSRDRDDDRPTRSRDRDDDRPSRSRPDEDPPSRRTQRDEDERPARRDRDDDRGSSRSRNDDPPDDDPRFARNRGDDEPARGERTVDRDRTRDYGDDDRPARRDDRDDRPAGREIRDDDRPARSRDRDDDRPARSREPEDDARPSRSRPADDEPRRNGRDDDTTPRGNGRTEERSRERPARERMDDETPARTQPPSGSSRADELRARYSR